MSIFIKSARYLHELLKELTESKDSNDSNKTFKFLEFRA